MATLISHFNDSLHGSADSGLGVRVRGLLARLKAYRNARRNRTLLLEQLAGADDRELRDLNISRYDFEAIAKGTFRR